MKLYDYYRSSAAYRLRIGLNLKGVAPERAFVHLRTGEQRDEEYLSLNPQGLVRPLVTARGELLPRSLAPPEWLDKPFPPPPILPRDPSGRARVRSLALAVACDIHPINNTRVQSYLTGTLGVTEEQKNGW